jgi:hypothetical protein
MIPDTAVTVRLILVSNATQVFQVVTKLARAHVNIISQLLNHAVMDL